MQQLIKNQTLGKATTLYKFKEDITDMGLVYSIHTHQGLKICVFIVLDLRLNKGLSGVPLFKEKSGCNAYQDTIHSIRFMLTKVCGTLAGVPFSFPLSTDPLYHY